MRKQTDAQLRRMSREELVLSAAETRIAAETLPQPQRALYLQFALRCEGLAREKGGTDPRTEQWLRLYDAAHAGAPDEDLRALARVLPPEARQTIERYIARRRAREQGADA